MFAVCLRDAEHVREFFVSHRSAAGWEIRSQEDHTLKRHAWYHDWHRVERTVDLFRREVNDLIASGWQIQSISDTPSELTPPA